jgi:hypothetical protein
VVGSLGTISIDSFDKSNETDLLAVEMTGVLSLDELELDFLPIEGGLGNKTGKLQIVSSCHCDASCGKKTYIDL